eukprot:TRINITY_DN9691_c0_g2_i1.p1 TRINITY_DN9691_c0_g2~~TRINITY_DN9691_c0_g2_i1.p1  ORF type:complete len:1870 (-),score=435.08 TRINITY_DN9691_c0_g2_i1:22-5631(-)
MSFAADLQGYLEKTGGRNPAYQRRWCVLRGNVLAYYGSQPKDEKQKPNGVIELKTVRLRLHTERDWAWEFQFGDRIMCIAAESQEEYLQWLGMLRPRVLKAFPDVDALLGVTVRNPLRLGPALTAPAAAATPSSGRPSGTSTPHSHSPVIGPHPPPKPSAPPPPKPDIALTALLATAAPAAAAPVSAIPGSEFEGYLEKTGGANPAYQKRYFVLVGKTLAYYKTNPATLTAKSKPQGAIELDTVKLDLNEDRDFSFQFTMHKGDSKRIMCIAATSAKECRAWLDIIHSRCQLITGNVKTYLGDDRTTDLDFVRSNSPQAPLRIPTPPIEELTTLDEIGDYVSDDDVSDEEQSAAAAPLDEYGGRSRQPAKPTKAPPATAAAPEPELPKAPESPVIVPNKLPFKQRDFSGKPACAGFLEKTGGSGEKYERRYCIVRDTDFAYYKNKPKDEAEEKKPRGVVELHKVKLRLNPSRPMSFQFISLERIMSVAASSQSDFQRWLSVLRKRVIASDADVGAIASKYDSLKSISTPTGSKGILPALHSLSSRSRNRVPSKGSATSGSLASKRAAHASLQSAQSALDKPPVIGHQASSKKVKYDPTATRPWPPGRQARVEAMLSLHKEGRLLLRADAGQWRARFVILEQGKLTIYESEHAPSETSKVLQEIRLMDTHLDVVASSDPVEPLLLVRDPPLRAITPEEHEVWLPFFVIVTKVSAIRLAYPRFEGILEKSDPTFTRWTKRYCLMENNILSYYRNASEVARRGHAHEVPPRGSISLAVSEITRSTDDDIAYTAGRKFCILIQNQDRVYVLSADSEETREAWFKALLSSQKHRKGLAGISNALTGLQVARAAVHKIEFAFLLHQPEISVRRKQLDEDTRMALDLQRRWRYVQERMAEAELVRWAQMTKSENVETTTNDTVARDSHIDAPDAIMVVASNRKSLSLLQRLIKVFRKNYEPKEDENEYSNDARRQEVIEYVIYRLRASGLLVERVPAGDNKDTDVILISAPFAVLLREADRSGLRKKLTPEATEEYEAEVRIERELKAASRKAGVNTPTFVLPVVRDARRTMRDSLDITPASTPPHSPQMLPRPESPSTMMAKELLSEYGVVVSPERQAMMGARPNEYISSRRGKNRPMSGMSRDSTVTNEDAVAHARYQIEAGVVDDYGGKVLQKELAAVYGVKQESFLRCLASIVMARNAQKSQDGTYVKFTLGKRERFVDAFNAKQFFTCAERQRLVRSLVASIRVGENDALTTQSHEADDVDDADDEIEASIFEKGDEIVGKCVYTSIINGFFPMHVPDERRALRQQLVRFHADATLNDIRNYYGEKIAIYFAWVLFYTKWLFLPAIVGTALWLFQEFTVLTNPAVPFYNLLMATWATLFLEFWKRRNAELALLWGTRGAEEEEGQRPQYCGPLRVSKITGELVRHFPHRSRLIRYAVTIPLNMILLGIVIAVMIGLQSLRDTVPKGHLILSNIPSVLNAVVVVIFDAIYGIVAVKLTEFENHEKQSEYENHLIVKIFLFQFVNSFLSLYWIAFVRQEFDVLRSQLATLLLTRVAVNIGTGTIVPYVLMRFKRWQGGEARMLHPDITDKERFIAQANRESIQTPFTSSFDYFAKMVIQFGLVTLFASAFPLASLIALASNMVEMRGNLFNLAWTTQRPFPNPVETIGSWYQVMYIMSIIAIITNCGLIAVGTTQLDVYVRTSSTLAPILAVAVLEHIFMLLKFALGAFIPDEPEWVRNKVKEETMRLEAAARKLTQKQLQGADKRQDLFHKQLGDIGAHLFSNQQTVDTNAKLDSRLESVLVSVRNEASAIAAADPTSPVSADSTPNEDLPLLSRGRTGALSRFGSGRHTRSSSNLEPAAAAAPADELASRR